MYTVPHITINGRMLTEGEANTLRVAVTDFHSQMADPLALGSDEHGRFMTSAYRVNAGSILWLLGFTS